MSTGKALAHGGSGAIQTAASGLAGWGLYRALLATFGKCTKGCGTFKINTPKRQLCLAKCKLEFAKKKGDKEKIAKWGQKVKDYQTWISKHPGVK